MADLGVPMAIAVLVANNFWAMTGHDRFAAVNGFFEHRVKLRSHLAVRSDRANAATVIPHHSTLTDQGFA
jgi:hypothetical protein